MSEMPKVVRYGSEYCSYCMAARMLLKKKGVEFDDISVSQDPAMLEEMQRKSGKVSVPQIFIGGNAVGGFDELYSLEQSGDLDQLLGAATPVVAD